MEEKRGPGRPKTPSIAEKELDKMEAQFEAFDNQVKDLTLDRMNEAPKLEMEQQTKISNREAQIAGDIYLKPYSSIGVRDKFNEKFREQYEFSKQMVRFIAENKEIIGDTIEMWTRPYGGVNAEFWKVPVNKPVWGPRYLAEQIKRASYHRLVMQEKQPGAVHAIGQDIGAIVADSVIQRLDAIPVSTRKSIFMGADGF